MLYIVASPIGNLSDITFRAIEALKSVDYILCEDTRRASKLLHHYQIKKKITSFHRFNEKKKESQILQDLQDGLNIALLSDAGTPTISDPGTSLVASCHQKNLPITSLPGASSILVALSSSGIAFEQFQFIGFLPRKAGKLQKMLEKAIEYDGVTVAFETPHRIKKTLAILCEIADESSLFVARELTKKFEEFLQGTPKILLDHFEKNPSKGEFILLIEGHRQAAKLSKKKKRLML